MPSLAPDGTSKVEDDDHVSDPEAEDVPVNKITSFNGKLNQFIHGSSAPYIIGDLPSKQDGELKRRLAGAESEDGITSGSAETDRSTPNSKRRRATTKPPMSLLSQPPRLTRSRSSTSNTHSPPSPPIPPIVTSPLKPHGRGKRKTPRPEPPHPASTSTESLLRDTIPPNLILLLVGVNPGLMTGVTGYAYAHPSNLFWKLLYSSGITSTRHVPSDTYKLPDLYNVGNTNIVERPTRDASMLRRAEMDAGVPILEAKVAAQRPEAVGLVGKSIWEAVWRVRHGRAIRKEEFRYGWQPAAENMGRTPGGDWAGAPVFVATTTSGLAAGMSPAEKEAVWAELGRWVVQRRAERALALSEV
ncbi:hypothetical protein NUU61_008322 [Penicillium alfredii]|uniref:Uracil-DNA glycosylase-like domain-containing protein n=1 Tax=Penicillium alfredii TaxID=1506179 RepID=A0A9W9JZA2_9EURO|nr:uncharacterized protein NUU61_008322 [Penicillium alfredii]KAJ5087015.1 hypothetical protein NUU61_008322 [Penicillium alfredii]